MVMLSAQGHLLGVPSATGFLEDPCSGFQPCLGVSGTTGNLHQDWEPRWGPSAAVGGHNTELSQPSHRSQESSGRNWSQLGDKQLGLVRIAVSIRS